MVLGAFPIGKIIILGVKQITKPVSIVVKTFAKHNEIFKKTLCVPAGQLMNVVEARLKMYMLELPQPKQVPPLTNAMATDSGSNFLAEVFVLGVSLFLIYYEVSNQKKKDQKKHDMERRHKNELQMEISALKYQIDLQDKEIGEIKEIFKQLHS